MSTVKKWTTICRRSLSRQGPRRIPQEGLEKLVIETVLEFYAPCLEKDGRQKIVALVRDRLGCEHEEFAAARQRAEQEQQRVREIINNLLDNITKTNREHVDSRLKELNAQGKQLEARLEELERLACSQQDICAVVNEACEFLRGLAFTFERGLPQDKLAALRQCIHRIVIDKPSGTMRLAIRELPAACVDGLHEVQVSIG